MTTLSRQEAPAKTTTESSQHSERQRVADEAKHLKQDLVQVKDDVASVAGATADCMRAEGEKLGEYAQSGADKFHDYHQQMRRTVSRHPTAAILTTLGVGVIIGRILGGR